MTAAEHYQRREQGCTGPHGHMAIGELRCMEYVRLACAEERAKTLEEFLSRLTRFVNDGSQSADDFISELRVEARR